MSTNKDGSVNLIDLSSKTGEWYTPESELGAVRCYFGGPIPLDPLTRSDNPTKAIKFYTPKENGLMQDWSTEPGCFVNPPYGKNNNGNACIEKIAASAKQGLPIIMLISAARFETDLGQNLLLADCLKAVCFRKRRIKFIDEYGNVGKSNTFPSMYYGYNIDQRRFADAFREKGRVFSMKRL